MFDSNFIMWLKPHIKEIYGSHKNMGIKTFSVKSEHHHKKLDYVFITNKNEYGVIEYEHGERYGEITEGAIQLNDVYFLLKNGYKITIEGIPINNIRYFLLATKYSPLGYLYKNDTRIMNYSGYSIEEPLQQENNTIFHSLRWMWRFCGRDQTLMSLTNPVGVHYFSVLYNNNGPTIQLDGHYTHKLRDL